MNAVASAPLNDHLRAIARKMISEGSTLPKIQKQTGLSASTVRWIAYRNGLVLMTVNGPTTHTPTYWRTSLAPQPAKKLALAEVPTATLTTVTSPNYAALKAHLRW